MIGLCLYRCPSWKVRAVKGLVTNYWDGGYKMEGGGGHMKFNPCEKRHEILPLRKVAWGGKVLAMLKVGHNIFGLIFTQ